MNKCCENCGNQKCKNEQHKDLIVAVVAGMCKDRGYKFWWPKEET